MAGPGFAIIDLETTGLFPGGGDRVIEVAVVHADENGTITGEWDTLVNPVRHVGAEHVHRIRAVDLIDAPRFETIAPRLIDLMSGRVLVAHNASFDRRFLETELARARMPLPPAAPVLCTMQLARELIPGAGRSLADCCAAFDIALVGAHRPDPLDRQPAMDQNLARYALRQHEVGIRRVDEPEQDNRRHHRGEPCCKRNCAINHPPADHVRHSRPIRKAPGLQRIGTGPMLRRRHCRSQPRQRRWFSPLNFLLLRPLPRRQCFRARQFDGGHGVLRDFGRARNGDDQQRTAAAYAQAWRQPALDAAWVVIVAHPAQQGGQEAIERLGFARRIAVAPIADQDVAGVGGHDGLIGHFSSPE